jgi:hypothetical protein
VSEELKIYQPKCKNMPDARWCVFNCSARDKALAKNVFVKQFGQRKWREVARKMKTGIMELFNYPPNQYTAFYVNYIASRVDTRQLRKEAA